MNNKCLFCKIVKGEEVGNIIYTNSHAIVALDQDWAVLGHTLIIYKDHVVNSHQLSPSQFQHLTGLIHLTERALSTLLPPDTNFVVTKVGINISHLHYHIYPVAPNTTFDQLKEIYDKKTVHPYTKKERTMFKNSLKKSLQEMI